MDKDVRKYLIELAKVRGTVAYGKAMAQFNFNVSNQAEIDYFADIIGDISIYEAKYSRPMLSALVIHASGYSIGKGFYRLAETLNHGDKNLLLKSHFERTMQNRCFEFWRNPENFRKFSNPENDNSFDALIKEDSDIEGWSTLPVRQFGFDGVDIDWVSKHNEDIECGAIGEELVIEYEKQLLRESGYDDWETAVEKVKDGMGYDILSRYLNSKPKYIEVKTTTGKRDTPFNISINEVVFSEKSSASYHLYRLYDLDKISKRAKFTEYTGSIREQFHLDSVEFQAFLKKRI